MDGENKIVELKLEDILPNRFQPRISFNDEDLTELANSIREHGVLQPITVRPLGNKYEIVMGERRYKASKLAGKITIPAIIKNLSDNDSAEVALVENIQRQDLTAIEEAICYKRILDAGYLTQENLAIKLGKTQSTIANKLRLLSLDEEVQKSLLDKSITERHARSLLKLENKADQRTMLKKIINERLTVRKVDEEIDKMNRSGNINIPSNMNDNMEVETLDFDDKPMTSTPVAETPTTPAAFNIPVSPIVESDAPVNNSQVQYSFLDNKNESTNDPGFMNVDNIVAKAQDINIEKPVKNIDNIFLPPRPEESDEDGGQKADDLLRPNKFLNILGEEESKTEGKELPEQENFDFNSYFAPVFSDEAPVAKPEPQVSTQPPVTPVLDPSNIFAPIEDSSPVPEIEQIVEEKEPIDIYKGPTEDQLNTIQEKKTSTVISNDMRLVINTIRECANRLEDAGYIVDLEEIDFEDSYQAIFKINKM